MSSQSEQNKQVVRRIYNAFGQGDISAALAEYDPQVKVHQVASLPYGGVYHGRSEVEGFIAKLLETWEVAQFPVEEYIASGDKVIVRETFNGRARATGLTVAGMPVVEVFTLQAGKVIKVEVFYADTAALLKLLA